jgi:hypothetical protein
MLMKITFELNGKQFKKQIEGDDYKHVLRKARGRCHYRRHIYGDDMKIVSAKLSERKR